MATAASTGIPARIVGFAALGYAGGAMCVTLLFLGMRSVMDIGGSCAEGGPYEIAASCPDAAVPAMFIGMFGLFAFGTLATLYGVRVGGIWAAAPLLGWSALFGALGWNFMEYGVFNVPPEYGIDWGWAICGVVFWIMAAGPLLALGSVGQALRSAPSDALASRQAQREARRPYEPDPAPASIVRIVGPDGVRIVPADDPAARAQLAAIARAMDAALDRVEAVTPALVDDAPGPGSGDDPGIPTPDFGEATQALLDRLERLADMRDRGLLEPAEYETAKDAIVRELEARQ